VDDVIGSHVARGDDDDDDDAAVRCSSATRRQDSSQATSAALLLHSGESHCNLTAKVNTPVGGLA